MAPRMVDRDEKRLALGHAALDHFSKNGFEKASMGQIAKTAKVGKGTLYEYFASKEELIQFSLELYVATIEEKATTLMGTVDCPRERFRQYVFNTLELFMNNPQSMGLLMAFFQRSTSETCGAEATPNALDKMFTQARESLVTMLLEGVEKGLFKPHAAQNAEALSANTIAYLDGIWIHSLISGKEMDLTVQVNQYLSTLFDSIDKGRI